MLYTLKSGILYSESDGRPLLRIGGVMANREKRVFTIDGALFRRIAILGNESGHVHNREYVMVNGAGTVCASAHPHYAEDDDPLKKGWPVYRAPRVDRADVWLQNDHYMLRMLDTTHYEMHGNSNNNSVRLEHKGALGGWELATEQELKPEMLVAFFAFCRYMEQENDFVAV